MNFADILQGYTTLKSLSPLIAKATGTHVGSWGTPEYGVTEKLQGQGNVLGAQAPSGSGQPTSFNINSTVVDPNNDWARLDAMPTGTQNTVDPNNEWAKLDAMPTGPQVPDINQQLASQRSMLDSILQRARGVYDQGMSALSGKRTQFQDTFNAGNEDILQEGQRAKGEAQTSSQGARTRNANALRALGLGGSAVMNTQGRQAQNEARTLASINDQTNMNKRQNTDAFNSNNDWANAQESSLSNYLGDAQLARQSGENQINTGLFDYMNNMVNNQMALAASNIGGYQVNPYEANVGDFTNSLTGIVNGLLGGQQQTGNETANLAQPTELQMLLKKQYPGLSF